MTPKFTAEERRLRTKHRRGLTEPGYVFQRVGDPRPISVRWGDHELARACERALKSKNGRAKVQEGRNTYFIEKVERLHYAYSVVYEWWEIWVHPPNVEPYSAPVSSRSLRGPHPGAYVLPSQAKTEAQWFNPKLVKIVHVVRTRKST